MKSRIGVLGGGVRRGLLALALGASGGAAASGAPSSIGAPPAVSFRADRLVLDPRLSRLELGGHVVIAADRYRLRSSALFLRWSKDIVFIQGSGRVALCPCPSPPVTFGFEAARLELPGDLVLSDPTVRLGDVPVLWLPALRLRSPERVGLLPLLVAFRGEDGLLLGSGVHVPVASRSSLDLGAAGYVRGGADVDARLTTPRTASVVRWDYLRGSALSLDLRGAEHLDKGSAIAWSVDSLRGSRALRSSVLLEDAALRQDRARAVAGFSDGAGALGIGASVDALRGAPIGSSVLVGPSAHAGWGAALGDVGAADLDIDLTTLDQGGTATSVAAQHGELRADLRAGPVSLGIEGRTRGVATLGENGAGHAVIAGGGAEIAAPLVKELGSPIAPWQHWVTPFAEALGGIADSREPSIVVAPPESGVFYVADAGVRTTIGEVSSGRGALGLTVRGGYLGEGGKAPVSSIAWTASGRAHWVALRGQGLVVPGESGENLSIAELGLGPEQGPFVGGRVEGDTGRPPPRLGRFLMGGWDAPWVPWLAPPGGWTVGGRIGVPWTRTLVSIADADYDTHSRTLLSVRGTFRYHHPCGCLGVTAWGGYRSGRHGVDTWVAVDLVP